MQPHQQRVVNELSELEERLDKLHIFIGHGEVPAASVFLLLDDAERARLIAQAFLMRNYRDILKARIAAFPA
jgi:crAss001_48 related protein